MSEPDHGPRTIVQATGRVAESIVGSMQTQPLLMALVLVNILFMGFLWWALSVSGDRRHKEMTYVMEKCFAQRSSP
jgi:hypothetical protein